MARWLFSLFVAVFFASALAAQQRPPVRPTPSPTPDPEVVKAREAERLARLASVVEHLVTDAQGLRLPENRAFVLARAGGFSWKSDKKAAQDLFQRAVGELAAAQVEIETEEARKQDPQELRQITAFRTPVLSAIAEFDGEYALEALYRTRTASIQRALGQPVEGQTPSPQHATFVTTEITLEQLLIRRAAEQNPEFALKLLQDALRKGLSAETFSLLRTLFRKDPELAAAHMADVMERLLSANFSLDPGDRLYVSLANQILNDSLRVRKAGTRELTFEEPQLRSLANRLINFALGGDDNRRASGLGFPALIRYAERYYPQMVAVLKKIEKASQPGGRGPGDDARKLAGTSITPQQMLTEARKLPAEDRSFVSQAAAAKLAAAGDYSGAIAAANANLSGAALDGALAQIKSSYVSFLIGKAKWDEAEQMVDTMSLTQRIISLSQLARTAFSRDPAANRGFALAVLNKVRSLLPDKPSNQFELNQTLLIAAVLAPIDADQAVITLAPVVPPLDELANANAIVQAFRGNAQIRSGEYELFAGPNFGFSVQNSEVWRTLVKADPDRTQKLIDSFGRRELRISILLNLAQTGLN